MSLWNGGISNHSNNAATSRRVKRVRLRLENLEDRTVPDANSFAAIELTRLRNDATFQNINGTNAIDGSGVGVAILDTGIKHDHVDIQMPVSQWYNAFNPASTTPSDPNGHGTHVAGTAAGRSSDIGVAYQSKLIAINVFDPATTLSSYNTQVSALTWVRDNHATHNIKVVNMSLGSGNTLTPANNSRSQLIDQLEALGITVVIAEGNSWADYSPTLGTGSPGIDGTIAVASTWGHAYNGGTITFGSGTTYRAREISAVKDQFSAFSQRSGLSYEIAAPGSQILSSVPTDGSGNPSTTARASYYGTSMASPLVAGVVALMQDAAFTFGGRYLTVAEVKSILSSTADVITDTTTANNAKVAVSGGAVSALAESNLSYKRVNAFKAVEEVRRIMTPTNDANKTLATSTVLGSLDGTNTVTMQAKSGFDGATNVGNNDIDIYQITVNAAGDLDVSTSAVSGGTNFDSYLRLFDSAGTQLAVNDDIDGSNNRYSRIQMANLAPGTYYLGVSAYNNGTYNPVNGTNTFSGQSQGDYHITATVRGTDPDGIIAGASLVSGVPVTRNGNIGVDGAATIGAGDVDMYSFVVPDHGFLNADIDTHSAPGLNSFLRIFRGSTQVDSNDDNPGPGQTTVATDSFTRTAVYRGERITIAVSNSRNTTYNPDALGGRNASGSTGAYALKLSFDNGDADGTIPTANNWNLTPVNGNVGTDGITLVGLDGTRDVDFFKFNVPSPGSGTGTYIDLNVAPGVGSALDPVLGLWSLGAGSVPVFHGNSETGSRRLVMFVNYGTDYYVSVTGRGNENFTINSPGSGGGGSLGAYTLTGATGNPSDLAQLSNGSVQNGTPRSVGIGAMIPERVDRDGPLLIGNTDVDMYRFTASAHQAVTVAVSASQFGDADTFLRLFDSNGTQIASNNDDSATGTIGSRLSFNATTGTTYYLGVNGNGATPSNYDALTGAGATAGSVGKYVFNLLGKSGQAGSTTITDTVPGLSASDVSAETDLTVTGATGFVRLGVRANAGSATYYAAELRNEGGYGRLEIVKVITNVRTVLATVWGHALTGNLRFDAVGNQLTLRLNGNTVLTAKDSSITASGSVVLWANGASYTTFSGTPIVAAALPFTDDFNRADGNQIGSNWLPISGTTRLTGNILTNPNPDIGLAMVHGIRAADVSLQADFHQTSAGYQLGGLVARYGGPADANYYVGGLLSYYGGLYAYVGRNYAGSFSFLHYAPVTVTGNGPIAVRFDALGSSLKTWVNGKVSSLADDKLIESAGAVGARLYYGPGIDNFNVQTITTADLPVDGFDQNGAPNDGNPAGSESWYAPAGSFTVRNNRLEADTYGANLLVFTNQFRADVVVDAMVTLTTVAGNDIAGLVARYTGPGDGNMYVGGLFSYYGTAYSFIARYYAGNWTYLTYKPVAFTSTRLQFVVAGNLLTLSDTLAGTILEQTTDGFLSAPGLTGVRGTKNTAFDSVRLFQNTSVSFPTDDFNRGNGPLGGEWLTAYGTTAIVGNAASVTAGGLGVAVNTRRSVADVSVSADVSVTPGTYQYNGVVARYSGPGLYNMYVAGLFHYYGQSYTFIGRYLYGSFAFLDYKPFAGNTGAVRFELLGDSLKLFVNNVLTNSTFDQYVRSPGLTGFHAFQGQTIDNFQSAALGRTMPFADNFTGTNGAGPSASWTTAAGRYVVDGNRLRADDAVNTAVYGGSYDRDVRVTADVTLSNIAGYDVAGVIARYSGPGDNNYYSAGLFSYYGTTYWYVARSYGGTWSFLGYGVYTGGATAAVQFDVVGSRLTLSLGGNEVSTLYDYAITGAGFSGLRSTRNALFDNFQTSRL